MIVDKIELNKGKLFAFVRTLENNNYIKKLFSLEFSDKFYESQNILKEIELINSDDNNSRPIPIKICIEENKSYILCIDENNLMKEINEITENNKEDFDCEITINNYIEKENDIEKIREIYSSDNLNKFIDLLKSFSDNNISKFVKAIEQIEEKSKIIQNIEFKEFIEHIKGKKEMIFFY